MRCPRLPPPTITMSSPSRHPPSQLQTHHPRQPRAVVPAPTTTNSTTNNAGSTAPTTESSPQPAGLTPYRTTPSPEPEPELPDHPDDAAPTGPAPTGRRSHAPTRRTPGSVSDADVADSGRGAADAGRGVGPGGDPFGADRAAAASAPAVRPLCETGHGQLKVLTRSTSLPQQCGHLGALIGDRRALRVVLVVGVGGLR